MEIGRHASPRVHRQGLDLLVGEGSVLLLRFGGDEGVDGVVGIPVVAFGPAVNADHVADSDVEVHADAPLVRVDVREVDVVEHRLHPHVVESALRAVTAQRAGHPGFQRVRVHDRRDAVVQAARSHPVSRHLAVEGMRGPRRGIAGLLGTASAHCAAAGELLEVGLVDVHRKVDRGSPLLGGEHRNAVHRGVVQPLHAGTLAGIRVRDHGLGAVGAFGAARGLRGYFPRLRPPQLFSTCSVPRTSSLLIHERHEPMMTETFD